jgi:hypothetical protein
MRTPYVLQAGLVIACENVACDEDSGSNDQGGLYEGKADKRGGRKN